MSRTLEKRKGRSSEYHKHTSCPFKLFIWDVGTDSRQPSESTIRSLAVVEFTSHSNTVAHFSTAVRPSGNNTSKTEHTPDFKQVWDLFVSFLTKYSRGKPPLLVSHNAAFDVTVLFAELNRAKIQIPSEWRFACSLLFARSVYPFGSDNSQLALAAKLGVSVKRQHHTPEDVIVLRNILKELDDKAYYEDIPTNRVIPALCTEARSPAFFDRTPQTIPVRDTKSAPKFVITATGTKYHRASCRLLRRSSIPRDTPPPGMQPCRICRPDDDSYEIVEEPSTRDSSSPSPVADTSRPSQVFITKSGSKYHAEGCKWLRTYKIAKDHPPDGYERCRTCLSNMILEKSSRRRDDSKKAESKSAQQEVSPGRPSEKAPFYITKTGKKYHTADCKSVRWSCIPQNKPPLGYDPCGICLPNAAFRGSPQLKRVPK